MRTYTEQEMRVAARAKKTRKANQRRFKREQCSTKVLELFKEKRMHEAVTFTAEPYGFHYDSSLNGEEFNNCKQATAHVKRVFKRYCKRNGLTFPAWDFYHKFDKTTRIVSIHYKRSCNEQAYFERRLVHPMSPPPLSTREAKAGQRTA